METPEIEKLLSSVPGTPLAHEIKYLLNLASKNTRRIAGRIVEFDKTIIASAGVVVNLLEFFKNDRPDIKLTVGDNFLRMLKEVTGYGKYPTVELLTDSINQYTGNRERDYDVIIDDLFEKNLRRTDEVEGAEIRRRLAILAYCLERNSKMLSGYRTVIAWTEAGFSLQVRYADGSWHCYCDADKMSSASPAKVYWSTNWP